MRLLLFISLPALAGLVIVIQGLATTDTFALRDPPDRQLRTNKKAP